MTLGSSKEVITIPAGYQLVFSDEFNTSGKSSPDSSKWKHDLGDGSKLGIPGWGNGEQEYYTPDQDNSFVQDGSLHIVAKVNDAATSTTDRVNAAGEVVPFTTGITSARLTTAGWKLPAYGYVEVRAKLPDAKGAWPAIWMLGQKGSGQPRARSTSWSGPRSTSIRRQCRLRYITQKISATRRPKRNTRLQIQSRIFTHTSFGGTKTRFALELMGITTRPTSPIPSNQVGVPISGRFLTRSTCCLTSQSVGCSAALDTQKH